MAAEPTPTSDFSFPWFTAGRALFGSLGGLSGDEPRLSSDEVLRMNRELSLERAKELFPGAVNPFPWYGAAIAPPVVAPPVVAPPVPGPVAVGTPPATIPAPPPVLEGEVLTGSQRIAYDLAKDAVQKTNLLRKYGGMIGGNANAARLGLALWREFGPEILAENAAKENAAREREQREADAVLRKGPSTRRAATTKSGKIKRPPEPPRPPPSDRTPRVGAPDQAKLQRSAIAQIADARKASQLREIRTTATRRELPASSPATSTSTSTGTGTGTKQTPGMRSYWTMGLAAASLLATPLKSKTSSLTSLLGGLLTKPGGGGLLGTANHLQTDLGEPGQQCRTVCKPAPKKRKQKRGKRKKKICVGESSLLSFIRKPTKKALTRLAAGSAKSALSKFL